MRWMQCAQDRTHTTHVSILTNQQNSFGDAFSGKCSVYGAQIHDDGELSQNISVHGLSYISVHSLSHGVEKSLRFACHKFSFAKSSLTQACNFRYLFGSWKLIEWMLTNKIQKCLQTET